MTKSERGLLLLYVLYNFPTVLLFLYPFLGCSFAFSMLFVCFSEARGTRDQRRVTKSERRLLLLYVLCDFPTVLYDFPKELCDFPMDFV